MVLINHLVMAVTVFRVTNHETANIFIAIIIEKSTIRLDELTSKTSPYKKIVDIIRPNLALSNQTGFYCRQNNKVAKKQPTRQGFWKKSRFSWRQANYPLVFSPRE